MNLYKISLKSFEIMNKYKCEWIYGFSSMTEKEVKKIVGKYKIHIRVYRLWIDYKDLVVNYNPSFKEKVVITVEVASTMKKTVMK